MLGERERDSLAPSEFADEYQDWLDGNAGAARAQWFDFPLRKLSRPNPLLVSGDAMVLHVVHGMASQQRGTALVMEGARITGIFTERDLLRRVVAEGRDPAQTPVRDVMSADPESLPETANLAQAMRLMSRTRYRHVPVTDKSGRPVGMLSSRHVIGFVSETFPKEILNAPPETAQPQLKPEGG
jgi:CBS domain-containing protein